MSTAGYSSWNDNLFGEEHLAQDVFLQTWRLGKSVKGNIVLKGQGSAFEITDKPAIALFLSECFLSGRQNPETKKQQLFDMKYEETSLRIGEEQLLYGQVYVQLLDDQFDTPLFSLNFDMKVREIASQIKIMLQLYMAGNFVDGDEDDTPPFKAPRYR